MLNEPTVASTTYYYNIDNIFKSHPSLQTRLNYPTPLVGDRDPTQDCLGFYNYGLSPENPRVRKGTRTKMYGGQVETTSAGHSR